MSGLMGDQLDISGKFSGQVSVVPDENPDDRASRIRRENRSHLFAEGKSLAAFVFILLALGTISILAIYEGFFNSHATSDAQKWSMTALTALLSGGISFFLGQKVGSK